MPTAKKTPLKKRLQEAEAEISGKVFSEMELQKMNVQQLSKLSKVSVATLNRFRNGTHTIGLNRLLKIAFVLDLKIIMP